MQKSFHKFATKRALAKGTHVTSKYQSLGLEVSILVMQFLVCASDSEQRFNSDYLVLALVELFGSLSPSLHFWN
jgi:hypothetical protein